MTTKQENRLAMYQAVRDFLTAGADDTKDLPEFASTFAALNNSIIELRKIAEMQKFDKSGFAREKSQLRNVLTSIVYDAAVKLTAYASLHNNLILLGEVRFNLSSLKHLSDNAMKDVAQIIYDRAMAYADVLKEYGITEEAIVNFRNTLNKYNDSLAKPRIGQTEKKQATEQMGILFDLADIQVEKLDALMNIIMVSRPNFYFGYKTARKVVARGNSSLDVKGKAYELPHLTPLRGVKFTFVREDRKAVGMAGEEVVVKKTARKGSFNIRSMPEGTYVVTVTKTGYKEKTVVVSINPGELSTISVEMERA